MLHLSNPFELSFQIHEFLLVSEVRTSRNSFFSFFSPSNACIFLRSYSGAVSRQKSYTVSVGGGVLMGLMASWTYVF